MAKLTGATRSLQSFLEQRRAIQNINIIVCSRHAKKDIPDVKVLQVDGFEDERRLPFLDSVLASPCSGEFFLEPMHTIERAKHSWEPASLILR